MRTWLFALGVYMAMAGGYPFLTTEHEHSALSTPVATIDYVLHVVGIVIAVRTWRPVR